MNTALLSAAAVIFAGGLLFSYLARRARRRQSGADD